MKVKTPKSNQVIWSIFVAALLLVTQLAGQGTLNAHAAADETKLDPAPLFAPGAKPTATLNVPASTFLGEDVIFSVTFDNPGSTAADVGYGPFVDIILDSTGADGDDGLGTTSISASFLGATIQSGDIYITTFNGSGYATHPFVVDDTGSKIIVSGTAGDKLVSIRLPFGSFTPEQPPAKIDVTVNMSNLADLGTPLTISARAGYEFGYTPLNDWCCLDASYPNAISDWNGKTVTPTLFTYKKTYSGPESETATGPNFKHQFTITVDIADGQTLTDLDLSDILPTNMQFFSLDAVTKAGTPASISIISTPSTATPGGTLTRRLSSVKGTTAEEDAQMTFTFYIPRDDSSSARVIDPTTGTAVISCNNASVSGSWSPIDARDSLDGGVITQNPGGCEYSLNDRSIAIQKGVNVVAGTGGGPASDMLIPDSSLEYRLNIQISDFFAYNGIVVTDTFSDGQHFDESFAPTLEVYGNTFALTEGAIDAGNFDISCNYSGLPTPVPNANCTIDDPASNDGQTTLTFRLSNELITRAAEVTNTATNSHVLSGNLVGGCVPLGGSATPGCSSFNDGGTTATIVFRTKVLHNFVDTYPSGDASVDQGDILGNVVNISGSALNTLSFADQGSIVGDGSSSSISIGHGTLSKTIYAINGSTNLSDYLDPLGSGKLLIKPGDNVTFRLTYDLITSDVENLTFADYMPLPVFQVADTTWSFLSSKVIPTPGVVALGPTDDFYSYMVAGTSGTSGTLTGNTLHPTATIDPLVISDSTSNAITVAYADYNDTRHESTIVDLLFTVTVTADPFADRLYLTNEAHAYEGTTNGEPSSQVDLVQFILTEPALVTSKAVIASDNPNAVFDPLTTGPVTFNAPGTPGARWSDTIFSGTTSPATGLRAYPIDSDVTGADAGDIISFAIVIENMGSSAKGAFEMTILDTLPDEFQVPAGGLNLRIANGDNSTTFTYHQADGTTISTDPTDLFTTGIRIDDPDPDLGACQAHSVGSGKNIIVITYDLQLKADVPPGDIINTSSITHYTGTPGGENYLPEPLDDTATVTVEAYIVKRLVSTELDNGVNSKTQVVIGELATYEVVLTVPEGSLPGAKLVDNLESGLAFVSLDRLIVSNPDTDGAGLADNGVYSSVITFDGSSGECSNCVAGITDGSSNPLIEIDGQRITFDLGTLTNTNRDNTVAETITITYSVVVVNVVGNQTNTNLTNSARLSWTGDALSSVYAEDITVIEPYIGTSKSASPDLTDAGNIVTFTITLTNPTTTNPDGGPATDAFDITWSDTVPASMTYESGTLAFGTCPATTISVDDSSDPILSASISDLAPGESCSLNFDAKIGYSVEPGNVITNTGTTWWTSLDDSNNSTDVPTPRSTYHTDSIERNGSEIFPGSGRNDYGSQGSGAVTIDAVVPHKYLISTSESFTDLAGGQRVAIGEIVRYRLTARLPEGTSTNFQIQDQLPNSTSNGNGHLTFLNDGTAKISFVSTDSTGLPIVSDTFDAITGISAGCGVDGNAADGSTPSAPSCVLSDWNIGSSNSTSANVDSYTSGSDVYFKLGTLRNNDNDADDEFVVIEFNALVDNFGTTTAVSNDSNDKISNSFNVTINGTASGGTSTDNVDVYVAEPALTVSKVVLTAPTDAGDTVVYTLTISAASGNRRATAFDLNLTDTLNANLTPVSEVITSSSQGTTCIGNGSGTTAYSNSINRVGQNITLTATCLDPGKNIVATITAKVIDTVPTATSISNTANLTYTSLPGDKGTTSNPTGSSISGDPGSNNGERNGSASPAQNDLRSSSSISVNLATPSFDKKDPNPLAYTIGQTVTYDIWVTLPEGVTQNLVVTDNIPSGTNAGGTYGMTYVSSEVLTSDAALPASYAGTDVTGITGVCAGSCTTGDDVVFTFGNVTTTANNISNDNTFIIRVVLRVDNIIGNQDAKPASSPYPTTLTNAATMSYTGAGTPKTDNATAITVIEPRIDTTKSITSPAPSSYVQSGDTVEYEIIFTNTGNSMAYDVTADDTLAQGVSYNNDAACTLNSVAAPVTVTGTTTLHFDGNPAGSWDIPVDGNVTCTYSLTAQSTLFLNGVNTNTVDADWFSLDNGNGRSYNDGTPYNFDGSQDTKTASFSTTIPTIAKNDDVLSQVVVGDTITFTLTIGGPTGTIRSAVVTDQLPAGLIYNNDAVIVGLTSVTPSVSASNDGTTPVTITWTWPGDTAVKSAANATIIYTARVADVASNSIGQVLSNTVKLDHNKADGTTATQLTDSHSSTVAEPIINTSKDVSPLANVKAGDVLTYTARFTNSGTSTAYDVTTDDTLAQGVRYLTGTDTASCEYFDGTSTSSMPVTVTNNTTWLRFDGNPSGSWDIPVTDPNSYIECTYTAHAVSGIFVDGVHTNMIDADWFSMNNDNGRSYDDSVTRPGVDEDQDVATASFSTDSADISKSDDGVTQVVIGQTVQITLTIDAPLGTLRAASVVDTLPAGLMYATGTQSVSAGISAATFTVSATNDGSVPVTLTWDFGDAVVTSSPISITYDAIVANQAGGTLPATANNVDGTNLVNQVVLNYTDVGGNLIEKDASDDFSVIEPVLSVDKTHADFVVVPDAGDSVHYTVTIRPTAASTSTAYDVHFLDVLPADVSLDLTNHSILVTLNDLTTTYDTSASSSATNSVDVVIADIPTTATSVVIEYWATLNNSVAPSQLISNTGNITWTSTPGSNSNERTGTGVDDNDYNDSSTDSFNVHDPAFSKSIQQTDSIHTIDPSVAIGETISFEFHITLPEGTTPSLQIADDLPEGLQYIVEEPIVVPAVGFIGTIPTPTITPTDPPTGSGEDITMDFGAITVLPDDDATNNSFSIRFRAVVLNEAGNQSPDILTNTATMTIDDKNYESSVDANIVEPVLTIEKTVSDPFPGPNQVMTFTVVVTGSSTPALDALIFDDLPADLTLDLASVSIALDGGAAGATDQSADNRVEVAVSSIPVGGTVTITYKATVLETISVGTTIHNTANVTWTSMPGTSGNERDGSDGSGGTLNDYSTSSDVSVVSDKRLSKTIIDDSLPATSTPEVTIGEVVTYEIIFNVPTGTTKSVVLDDQLDPGLAYVDCLSITASSDLVTWELSSDPNPSNDFSSICNSATVTPVYNPTEPLLGGHLVSFTFNDLQNSSATVESISIQYRAVILDVIENKAGGKLDNSATMTWDVGTLQTKAPDTLQIVEPNLTLEKTADLSEALPGTIITFTLTVRHDGSTSDAYDVLLEDILPGGLSYVPGSLIFIEGIAPNSAIITPPAVVPPLALDDSLAPTLRVRWDIFGRSPDDLSVIQFQAKLGALSPGSSVENTARVEWTSMPDTPGVQSIYNERSIERYFDPLSSTDIYGVSASFSIRVPDLPETGFSPNRVTVLPLQGLNDQYTAMDDLILEIPALGVKTPITGVPMSSNGWDLTWLSNQAGYLEGTAYPGTAGTTGITGHVYLADGSAGPFVNIHSMYWGQKIIVHMGGELYIYEVREVRRLWPDDISALKHSDVPTLSLITCQGYDEKTGEYKYRIAVKAVLIRVEAE